MSCGCKGARPPEIGRAWECTRCGTINAPHSPYCILCAPPLGMKPAPVEKAPEKPREPLERF